MRLIGPAFKRNDTLAARGVPATNRSHKHTNKD
jgi:hypothetical protein